ncbi:MAG: cobaltochelatase subunit CobN [Methanobacteriaceae archaeon]|nr:cobaltochelatase subunit CobN [Methanobacteriaceae archaeon]
MPSQMLKPVKMVVLLTGCVVGTVDPMVNDVYKNMLVPQGYDFQLKIYTMDDINTFNSKATEFREELKTTDIFFLFTRPNYPLTGMTYGTDFDAPADFKAMVSQMPLDARVFILGPTKPANITTVNITTLPAYSAVAAPALSKENVKRVLLEILRQSNAINISPNDTKLVPGIQDFIYHPDAPNTFTDRQNYIDWYKSSGHYKEGAPWIGITMLNRYYISGNMATYLTLIYNLESKGVNIIPYFYCTDPINPSRKFFMENGTTAIDALIACVQFGYWPDNQTVQFFTDLDVAVPSPVPIFLQTTLDDYVQKKSNNNLKGLEYFWLAMFEMQGRIEPILIGGDNYVGTDPETGYNLKEYVPYQPGIDQLINRTLAWSQLRNKDNNNKTVAIVYFDSTHDEGIPVTNGLNLYESLSNIIGALQANGYNTGTANLTASDLTALINSKGRNPSIYAPADVITLIQNGAVLVTKEEYLQWYSALPASLRQQVEDVWGPAPGNVMVYQDKIVIPGFMLGNIFLAPQPVWKWNGTLTSLNNNTLPPTHQYIAFYLYLQNKLHADALVHIGQHGTLELLPGHTNALTEDDWPNTLIGYLPNIHLLKMSDPLEAVINPVKRRSYAVTISYLIPPVTETALYGNLQEMHDLIGQYDDAVAKNNTERQEIIKNLIWEKINNEPGLKERLGITSNTSFLVAYNKLHNYLHDLQLILTPYGLHTFGELPDNETLEKFIDAIIAFDPVNRTALRDQIRNLLIQSAANEMNSLLSALRGEFIQPVSAKDPIRLLDTLPTGRNMYSFDPSAIPDSAAMIMGGKAAEEMLKRYRQSNNNNYPETVAIDIGDIITTNGQSIASIFYMLGVKPITENGLVIGTELIPLETLGRPRIDVLISDFHNFRSACPALMDVIDYAIRQVATANESAQNNYVRKHYLALKTQLYNEFLSSGMSTAEAEEQAERFARSRIFGLPSGADPHGVGVDRILWSQDNWTEQQLAETYLSYYSYAYGRGMSGVPAKSTMEALLRTVDTTMVIMPYQTPGEGTCLYRVSATLNFMVGYLTNSKIDSYIVKTCYETPLVKTMEESYYDDVKVTLLNPKWIEGKLREGPSGHASISFQIRDLFTSNALVDLTDSRTWQQIANTYLFDQNMYSKLDPSAAKIMTKFIYQAHQRGMIQLSSAQAAQLAQALGIHVESSNPDQPSTTTTSTGNVQRSYGASRGYQSSSVGETGQQSASSPETSGAQTAGDIGKSYEVSTPSAEAADDTPWGTYAVVGIVSVLALAGIGFFFKGSLFG